MYYTFLLIQDSNRGNDTFGRQGREKNLFYFYLPVLRHPKGTHREYSVKPLFI